MWGIHDWPRWMETADEHALLPVVPGPDDVYVMVAGGSGKHSTVVPNCCFSRAVEPEDQPLAAVTSRAAPPCRPRGRAPAARRRAAPVAQEAPGSVAGRLARAAIRAPLALRLALLGVLVLIVLAALNIAYQVARKPTELLGLVFAPAPLTLSETWTRYGAQFRAHATGPRPSRAPRRARPRREPGGSARAHDVALALDLESVRPLRARLERGGALPDHGRGVRGGTAALRPRPPGRPSRIVVRPPRLLVSRPLHADGAQPRHRDDRRPPPRASGPGPRARADGPDPRALRASAWPR